VGRVNLLEKLVNVVFAIALISGFAYVVRITEKPWPLVEGRPLVEQVGVCQFINLRTGVDNYMEALNVLGIRPDLETAVDLLVNGPPRFGRRYDCFANLSDAEAVAVIATKEYADIQLEVYRQTEMFLKPFRGF